MANYVKKGSGVIDETKQVPGNLPDNAFDRASIPGACTMSRAPNYVMVNATPSTELGFFFGSSASFASKATTEGGDDSVGIKHLTGSQHYVNFGKPTVGTRLDIHPLAWSGSADSVLTYVYKSSLGTGL